MEKIFIVNPQNKIPDLDEVQKFVGVQGKIKSVTPNFVSASSHGSEKGCWLVVADNGKGLYE
jgi:hypothetical protein